MLYLREGAKYSRTLFVYLEVEYMDREISITITLKECFVLCDILLVRLEQLLVQEKRYWDDDVLRLAITESGNQIDNIREKFSLASSDAVNSYAESD